MSSPYTTPSYGYPKSNVISASVDERVTFIRRTYLHLLGAILAFVLIEVLILGLFGAYLEEPVRALTRNPVSWLVVLGAFMGISYFADRWAHSNTSRSTQYFGLTVYVLAEALIFIPLLYIAENYFEGTIQSAGIITAVVFGGLTATVFVTKADFSWMRMGLTIGMFVAMGIIVCGLLFGWNVFGTWFSVAMIILASGCIVFNTSNVLHHYRVDQHVAASLSLFASVALLFWYVLQLVMASGE